MQSSASESGLDAILSKNNKLLGTGTNSLQSSEIPSDEEDPSLGDTEQYRNSPNAPRGSPTAPSSTPRDSPQLNVVINQDTLNQSEAGDEVAPESDVQESNELLTGVCLYCQLLQFRIEALNFFCALSLSSDIQSFLNLLKTDIT